MPIENRHENRFPGGDFLRDTLYCSVLESEYDLSDPFELFDARAAISQYLAKWRHSLRRPESKYNLFPIGYFRRLLHDEEINQCLSYGLALPDSPTIEEAIDLLNSKKKILIRTHEEGESTKQLRLNLYRFDSDPEMMTVSLYRILSEYYQQFLEDGSVQRVGLVALSEPFHLAHMRYLWEVKKRCSVLFVGLDTDWVIGQRKVDRPIFPYVFRAATLLKMKAPDGTDLVDGVFPVYSMGGITSNVLFSITAGTAALKDIQNWPGLTFFATEGDPEINARFVDDFASVPGDNRTEVITIPRYCPNVSTTALAERFDLKQNKRAFSQWPQEADWRKLGAPSGTVGGFPLVR